MPWKWQVDLKNELQSCHNEVISHFISQFCDHFKHLFVFSTRSLTLL